jgi:surfactin synthase thioesterase subunit
MTAIDEETQRWLRRFHHEPARHDLTLVIFPHAGGSASYFFAHSAGLAPVAKTYVVQYPGRQDRHRESLLTDIDAFVDRIAPLVASGRHGQLVLFGHSMGAVIAFEVARRLDAQGGADLAGLVVSGRRGPTIVREDSVHLRSDEGILAEVRRLDGSPWDETTNELWQMALPAIRADYTAIETYRYRPGLPLACPVTAFVGGSDPRVSPEDADTWRLHTSAAFQLRRFPGGHFYLTSDRPRVVAALRDELTAFATA